MFMASVLAWLPEVAGKYWQLVEEKVEKYYLCKMIGHFFLWPFFLFYKFLFLLDFVHTGEW